jgi:hypothetical protein
MSRRLANNEMNRSTSQFRAIKIASTYILIKKKIKVFLIYKEIQNGAVAKSYMTNGLLIYGEIFAHFLIY